MPFTKYRRIDEVSSSQFYVVKQSLNVYMVLDESENILGTLDLKLLCIFRMLLFLLSARQIHYKIVSLLAIAVLLGISTVSSMLALATLCVVLACSFCSVFGGGSTYCVKPRNMSTECRATKTSCDCEELQYYASNSSYYFSSDATLKFLPGEHFLVHTNVSVQGVSNLMLTGETTASMLAAQDQQCTRPQIICTGEAGFLFQSSTNLTISSLSFIHCGQWVPPTLYTGEFGEAKASLAFDTIKNLTLDFLGVYNSTGYGVLMHNIDGHSVVRSCHLLYNRGSAGYRGGNALFNYTDCSTGHHGTWSGAKVEILDSVFSFGGYDVVFNDTHKTGVFATGIALTLSCSGVSVTMENVTVEGNQNDMGLVHKGFGGNVFIHFFNATNLISNTVQIRNSRFLSGSGWIGGGIGVSLYIGGSMHHHSTKNARFYCVNTVTIENSVIDQNKAASGSGFYLNYVQYLARNNCSANISLVNCTLRQNQLHVKERNQIINRLVTTGVITVIDDKLSGVALTNVNTFNLLFDNVTVENSTMDTPVWGSAALYVTGFLENFRIHNCKFQYNFLTAITSFRSHLTFSGNNSIYRNSGLYGGGMILCESSYIILIPNTGIYFVQNEALHSGGGIYSHDSCTVSTPLCFYQVEGIHGCGEYKNMTELAINCNITVVLSNNTAGYAGSQIYGGSVANCYIHSLSNVLNYSAFKSIFHLEAPATDLSRITSSPKIVCFCGDLSTIDCMDNERHYQESVYPGESITLLMVVVGQLNGTVPAALRVNTTSNITYSYFSTGTSCTQISFTAFSGDQLDARYEFVVISQASTDTSYAVSSPKYLNVSFRQCPKGFEWNRESGTCDCNNSWGKIECDFTRLVLSRSAPAWLGHVGDNMLYQDVCPYDYCREFQVELEIVNGTFNPDKQCSPNRTGILCGACQEGLSVSASSSACIDCMQHQNLHLAGFVLSQLLCGVALIVLLTLANWTITDGTFSGLLFYANVFKLNMFLFLPREFNGITVIMSIINLEFHFTNCIYNGLDSYMKAWLAFVFPVYVWTLILAIIYLSKHSERIARLFDGNGVKILATLIELSYTGLTQAVVTAVSQIYVTVTHESTNQTSTLYCWAYDPNVPYFGSKHLPLFLTGILFGFLILAHTLVLLFIQPLQSCSHRRCFSWVAKLKPLIDAYTSPHLIKAECQFWPGLLLTVRLVLVITFSFNVKLEDGMNLTAILSSCLFIGTVAWTVGGIYKKTYLNLLNSFFILNLAVLALVRNSEHSVTVPYMSASLTILVMLFVLVCHVILRLKRWFYRNRDSVVFLRNPLLNKDDCQEDSALLPQIRDSSKDYSI